MAKSVDGLLALISESGGAVPRAQLSTRGYSKHELSRAVAAGAVDAIGRKWIVLPEVNPSIRLALQHGAVLAGASALRSYGIWVTHPGPPVVAVRRDRRLLSIPPGAELVRGTFDLDAARPWRVSVVDALAQFSRTASRNDFVASADSAFNKGFLRLEQRGHLEALMPRTIRPWVKLTDGRADSGLESFLRLGCTDAGLQVEPQAQMSFGRVDTLIERRVIGECDGSAYHDDPASAWRDRQRSAAALREGFIVQRFGYDQIMYDLDGCIRLIQALLAR